MQKSSRRHFYYFSSPEPKAPGKLIGREGSGVRRPSSSVHNFNGGRSGALMELGKLPVPGRPTYLG